MTNNHNTGTYGVTLAELKERIYKALGEHSVNGEQVPVTAFEKADMEKSIINAINTSVTRAVQYLPVFTRITELYFPEIKALLFKEKMNLKEGEQRRFEVENASGKAVVKISCCGNARIEAIVGGQTLCEHIASCEKCGEIKTFSFAFELENGAKLCVTALDGGVYIDSLYCADAEGLCADKDAECFPKYGETFAKACADIRQISYASSEGESIPVYKYSYHNGYVYTSAENAGKTLLHYLPKPLVFTQDSDADEKLCLPEITICAIVYLAASELCSSADADVYNRLSYKYRDIVLNCYDRNKEERRNSFYSSKARNLPERRI